MTPTNRAGWGAKAPRWTTKHKKPISEIFIHHGGTTLTNDTYPAEAAALRGYQNFHRGKGWADIAYSFAVGVASGRVYELRGWGNRPGATRGHNKNSYAIVIIGDTTKQPISQAAVDAVRELVELGQKIGRITADPTIKGHRDVKATACPGDSAYAHLAEMSPNAVVRPHPSTVPPFVKVLRLRRPRMRGVFVRWVQGKVGAKADGVFGPLSRAAVQQWQFSHGLIADGIVGRKTYKALIG